MVSPIRRMLPSLGCFLSLVLISTTHADDPTAPGPAPRQDRRVVGDAKGDAEGDRSDLFALPGEDPPQKFVPLHPQTVEERRQIEAVTEYSAARAFERENLWNDAIALLEKALVLEPDSLAVLKRLSNLSFMLGKTDQGLKYGRRVLEADPGDADMITVLVAHYAKNDPPAAEGLLKEVLANPRLEKGSFGYLVAQLELGKLYWDKLHQEGRAADAFARVVETLDEKGGHLTQAEHKRVLGGDESAAASAYLDFGLVFAAAKRHDLAIKAFLRGLDYDEDDPQLPLVLAQTLLDAGKGEEALERLEGYLKRQPQGAEGYDLLAKILTALHREGEITPRLEALAKVDSKNVLLQYALADRYRETGQVERAERMYKELLAMQPTTQGYGALAASLFKRKKTDELLKVMTEALTKQGGPEAIVPQLDAIEHDPAYAEQVLDAGIRLLSANPPALDYKPALIVLAHIATRTEKLDKLVALQRFVLKQNPSPVVYREIAETLSQMHRYGEAAATLEELMAKYPDEKNPSLLVFLASFRKAADQNEAALEAVQQALKLDPTDTSAQMLAIQLLSLNGKVDEAVAVSRNLLKDDPSNPEYNRLLGYILSQFGRSDEAIALYRGLLERFPNNREVIRLARSGLSVTYINLGDYAKGEAELETLLQLDPEEPGVNNDLGYLYADQGKNLEKAEAMIRKAIQEEPDSPAYLDSLGWVLFKRGKIKDALEPLEKAVDKIKSTSGGDSTIFEHLGDVYFQLQELAKAKDAWQEAEKAAVKAVPTDKRLPEIRKKLESLKTLGVNPRPSGDDAP